MCFVIIIPYLFLFLFKKLKYKSCLQVVQMFEKLELQVGSIPEYIKMVFFLAEYKSITLIKSMDDADIQALVMFVRNKMAKELPHTEEYFGTSYLEPYNFDFPPGHLKLIKIMIQKSQLVDETTGIQRNTHDPNEKGEEILWEKIVKNTVTQFLFANGFQNMTIKTKLSYASPEKDDIFVIVYCPLCKVEIHTYSEKNKMSTLKFNIRNFTQHFNSIHLSDSKNQKRKIPFDSPLVHIKKKTKIDHYFGAGSSQSTSSSNSIETPSTSSAIRYNSSELVKHKNAATIDPDQKKINEYFNIIKNAEPLLQNATDTQELSENMHNLGFDINMSDKRKSFLELLLNQAEKNNKRVAKGNRYDEVIKDFSKYIYLLGGRKSYELLSKNLALPAPVTTLKSIHKDGGQIDEGELQKNELKEFLVKRKLPMYVFISEDATRVVPKIKYDSKTNQIIGKFILICIYL